MTTESTEAQVPHAREMRMEWSTDAGQVVFLYPSNLSKRDAADLEDLIKVAFSGILRRAQAMETRRAETTGSVGVADDSAVPQGCAQKGPAA